MCAPSDEGSTMLNRPKSRPATIGRISVVVLSAAVLLGPAALSGQDRGSGQQARPDDRRLARILGGVEMTAADSAVKAVVDRLDFDSYKEILRGLTEFGDREQGTERNARAIDWIEAQLRGWGYETERIHYQFTARGATEAEPREEVCATKVGGEVPGEMYILGAHMDGGGGGQAANDGGSGTALVMEIARVLADDSAALALKLLNANRVFATDYPAVMSNAMSNTDSGPFQDLVAAVSLRENRRLYETGDRANPHWHQPTDLFVTFSDADFRLGFNAAQTTFGAVARLVEARVVGGR